MDLATQRLMQAAAGAGDDKLYVDDVFNPFLYAGTNGALTGNSGLDLSGEGGMIWIKNRTDSGRNNILIDTERGVNKVLKIDTTGAETTNTNANQTFTSTGFTLNNDFGDYNASNNDYCAWNFRKAKGFLDIVTYTGNGSSSGQEVAHSLGSVPGCVIIKCLQSNDAHAKANSWIFFHRSLTDQHFLYWNLNENEDGAGWFQKSDVTSTYVRVPKNGGNTAQTNTMNRNGYSYVMYLFAHDEQTFGEEGDQSIIKCGNYTGNGNNNEYGPFVTLGWEPQFIMIKSAGDDADWNVLDSMRGIVNGENSYDAKLKTENSGGESNNTDWLDVHPTGFRVRHNSDAVNGVGKNIVYVAIRRSDGYVGKPPELGTDVFAMDTGNGNSSIPVFDSGFPVDLALYRRPASTENWWTAARLTGKDYLVTNTTAAKGTNTQNTWDSNVGWGKQGFNNSYQSWMWKRHAGFDVVTPQITTESGYPSYNHSLGVPPEMIWSKRRDAVSDWTVYHKGINNGTNPFNYRVRLNETAAQYEDTYVWGLNTNPTSTAFTAKGASFAIGFHIFILFASVEGISKIGHYTGNGTSSSSTQTISTGFAPRFLIIKNTTDANSWFVADTVRGWASGDDQLLMLDSNSGQLAIDWGVPTSSGFTLTGNNAGFNANNKNYIYYAHA